MSYYGEPWVLPVISGILTLHYDFVTDKSLVAKIGPTLTIARADATATRVNASGNIESVAADTARFDHTLTTGASLGLLSEETRTNICLHSENLSNAIWVVVNITKDTTSVTAPDNTANTNVRLSATAANGTCFQTITSAIDDYVYSVYMKRVTGTGNIDLTIDGGTTFVTKTLTSAWQRFNVSTGSTTNPVVGVRIVTSGDEIDFWGSECNKNRTFPTSYIPTVGASVTRNKDDISTTDVSWYKAAAGTFYVHATPSGGVLNNVRYWQLSDSTTNDEHDVFVIANDDMRYIMNSGGAPQANLTITTPSVAVGVDFRDVVGFADNDVEHFKDGTRSGTGDQSATGPVGATELTIGQRRNKFQQCNAHIREFRYYDGKHINSVLENLSNGIFP